jgi:hypothetical protein
MLVCATPEANTLSFSVPTEAPECLQGMARVLDQAPQVTLVVGGRRLIVEKGGKLVSRKYAKREVTVPGFEVINRCIFGANYIGEPSAVMFRK